MKKDRFENYANAIFSLAKEEDAVLLYKRDALEVIKVLNENPEFVGVLASLSVPLSDIENTIDKVFGALEARSLASFLKEISKKHIIQHYESVLEGLISLCNAELGVKEGIIYSVDDMSNEDIKRIEDSLSKKLDCEVSLENRIDHTLIGGYKISIDGKMIDASISSKLNRLKAALSKGGK
ncbi:MAG: F0F1 ATP synthase subunit delta [Bacilli bacterium]|nr:F0F1 ATP synthase subunit delta [Bacilli bacterium]